MITASLVANVHPSYRNCSSPITTFGKPMDRTAESYESELAEHRRAEIQLRKTIVQNDVLLQQKDELIRSLELLGKESDHRFLNDLQMVVSLLSLQGRASSNAEVAAQLAGAADRIATIGCVHRRLHSFDGVSTVSFKRFLEDICGDFSRMFSLDERPEGGIKVEAIDLELPAATAIPLSFIVNELVTNAAKYGTGRIVVSLERNPQGGYALSISNSGRLPDGFDPATGTGMGMKIIRSFVERIGGELRISRGRAHNDGNEDNQQTRFTVLFHDRARDDPPAANQGG